MCDRDVPTDNITFCSEHGTKRADKHCSVSEPSIPAEDGCRNSFSLLCWRQGRRSGCKVEMKWEVLTDLALGHVAH